MAKQSSDKKYIKGLFKDTAPIDQPEGTWRHATNMILNDTAGAVSNEGGTELSGHLGDSTVNTMFSYVGDPDAKVIGKVEVDNDRVVLFSIDLSAFNEEKVYNCEIGIWMDGVYSVLFKTDVAAYPTHALQFSNSYPIEGTFKIDSKDDLIVYWTDDLNSPRAFNVSRQQRWLDTAPIGNPHTWLYGIDPSTSHIDHLNILNLFPNSGPIPNIYIHDIFWASKLFQKSVTTGGGLLTGVYHLGLAYVDDDQVATNYLTISNPVSIVDEYDHTTPTQKKDGAKAGSQTSKAIKWRVNNINTDYKYMRPVVIRKMGEATDAFKLSVVEVNPNADGDQEIVFSGLEGFTPSSVEDVIIDTTSYETAKTINQLDGVLYLGNLTGTKDLGYQKYANNIKLTAKTKTFENFDTFYATIDNLHTGFGNSEINVFNGSFKDVDESQSYRYIPNIVNWKGYQRDEVYAFYIAFILKDGSTSYAYHIPGRAPLEHASDNLLWLDGNLATLPNFNGYEVYEDSALGDDGNGSIANMVTGSSDLFSGTQSRVYEDLHQLSASYSRNFHFFDFSRIAGSNDMNYWENATEVYPNTDNYDVWDETGKIGSLRNDGVYNSSNINVRHHKFPSNENQDFTTVKEFGGEGQSSGNNCEVEPTDPGSLSTNATAGWDVTFFAFAPSSLGVHKRTLWNTGPGTNAADSWIDGCSAGEIGFPAPYTQVEISDLGYTTSCGNPNDYIWLVDENPLLTMDNSNWWGQGFTSNGTNSSTGNYQQYATLSTFNMLTYFEPLKFTDSQPYGLNEPFNAIYDSTKETPTNFQPLPISNPPCEDNNIPSDNTFVTHPTYYQKSAFDHFWNGSAGRFTADQQLTVKIWVTMWYTNGVDANGDDIPASNQEVSVVARLKTAGDSYSATGYVDTSITGGVSAGAGGGGQSYWEGEDTVIDHPLDDGVNGYTTANPFMSGKKFCACTNQSSTSAPDHRSVSNTWNVIDMRGNNYFEFDLEAGDTVELGYVWASDIVAPAAGSEIYDQKHVMRASGCMDFDTTWDNLGQPVAGTVSGWHKYNPTNSQIKFEVKTSAQAVDDFHYNDVKVEHSVQALGFTLDDIKIPKSIADKVQGFRVYYAKRGHANKTIMGQAPSIPMQYDNAKVGMCEEAWSSVDPVDSAQIMANLSEEPISILRKHPFATWSIYYKTYDHIYDGLDTTISYNGYKSFHFPDFYLTRTKNSLSAATHIKPVYAVKNFCWNGPSLRQDKKMNTEIIEDTQFTPPLKRLQEVWGYETSYNCWAEHVNSALFIGCHYNIIQSRDTSGWGNSFRPFSLPRVIGQKAISYLRGDSIFNAESLGFGGTITNERGESTIIYSLKDRHERIASQQSLSSSCSDHSRYGSSIVSGERPFLLVGDPLTSLNGTSNQTPVASCNRSQQNQIDNLCSFKTDVYKSIDNQELVWTGFEVLGQDLNNFIFWDTEAIDALPEDSPLSPTPGQAYEFAYIDNTGTSNIYSANYSIYTLQSLIQRTYDGSVVNPNWEQFHIFGGDTFICRYGVSTGVTYSDSEHNSAPVRAVYYQIVESPDNINFRHIESSESTYFPATSGSEILKAVGQYDLGHQDNIKYNSNYSAVNDIKPAFPLPILQDNQSDFPTRTHRSVKTDTSSLIDNYRIFKANQFKDLPKHRGDLWRLSTFNNLLYFHMQESLYAAKGKQSMQMKDGSEAFVGSGDIFQQEPDEIIQTKGGFGGTQSQWAALTTRGGYFFIDSNSKKIFLMKDKLNEISKLGMENWFEDNMLFTLEEYGYTGCSIDNPIEGMGFHSVYDPVHKRIILTKRELIPTDDFIEFYNLQSSSTLTICGNYTPLNKIRFNSEKCIYEQWKQRKTVLLGQTECHWFPLQMTCKPQSGVTAASPLFTCGGWTISYYPELNIWGSFHDYIPYLYFNTSKDFYSITDIYTTVTYCTGGMIAAAVYPFCATFDATDLTAYAGTTFGNAGIWKHNSTTNHGILYQENNNSYYSNSDWLETISHYLFEFEFIHNEVRTTDSLLASFAYTLETLNQARISVLEHGFTSFFVYNTFQVSGEDVLEYLVNTRRIGNSWKVNAFRDLAAIVDQTGTLGLPNTSNYYTSTNPNIIGGVNTGTLTTSSINPMFNITGMSKTINTNYIDITKTWDQRRKFIDKWVGIRLIYDNISNNLLNLYSTNVVIRKLYR
jgi:hypothetical protein